MHHLRTFVHGQRHEAKRTFMEVESEREIRTSGRATSSGHYCLPRLATTVHSSVHSSVQFTASA